MADDLTAPFLRAVAAQAEGTVRLAENQAREALDPLRRAWMEWQELEVPFEAARVRVLMGLACRQLADDEAARMEFDAARHVFLRLGAAPEVARVDRLITSSPTPSGPRLTARELQIIKLLAAGRTNRDIARQLAISERTVDRHVSNILTKLDLPSRSAATAYAYQHDLV
jgi:DNA-binding CsgD family transcriptional regulator